MIRAPVRPDEVPVGRVPGVPVVFHQPEHLMHRSRHEDAHLYPRGHRCPLLIRSNQIFFGAASTR